MPMKDATVILIAGWAHGAEAMAPLAEALQGRHQVVSTSVGELYAEAHRGGEITDDPGGLSRCARGFAGQVAELDGPAALVGWSAGGMVAIEAAAALPQQVVALTVLSAAARFCSDGPQSPGVAPAALRAMRGRIGRAPEAVLRDFFASAAAPKEIFEAQLQHRVAAALELGVDCLLDGLDYLRSADLEEAAKSLELPTLLLHGAEDRILPWPAGENLARLIPRKHFEILSGTGHLLIEQRPDIVGRRILKFLEDEP